MITDNYIFMHLFTPSLLNRLPRGVSAAVLASYVVTSLAARRLSAPTGTRPEVRETITSVFHRVSACSVSGYDGLVVFLLII